MEKKPNIILITIDCLRADYCGWLNPEKKELTPFLNKLAKESIVFTQAYATGPSIPFVFPGILTGTYPLSFKGWNRKTFPGLEQRPYLPEILKNNGYFTMAVHDNPYLSTFFGYHRGFDIFEDLKTINVDIKKRVNFFGQLDFITLPFLRKFILNKFLKGIYFRLKIFIFYLIMKIKKFFYMRHETVILTEKINKIVIKNLNSLKKRALVSFYSLSRTS